MRLRGHHLLCLKGFAGHGYDDAFTARVAVLASAAGEPGAPVAIVAGGDDVCDACPHVRGGRCAWPDGGEEAVAAHDSAVLAAVGLRVGDSTTFDAVHARIDADPALLATLLRSCRGCRWTGVCGFARRAELVIADRPGPS